MVSVLEKKRTSLATLEDARTKSNIRGAGSGTSGLCCAGLGTCRNGLGQHPGYEHGCSGEGKAKCREADHDAGRDEGNK